MPSLDRLDARRIALIKPSALGDVVHALPVLTALRVRFPAARITWVVNKAYEPLIRNHPDLTDTLPFDRDEFRKGLWRSACSATSFALELRRREFDLAIDLQGLFRTGLMCLATGSPRRIGFANAREGSRYAYTHAIRIPDAGRIHAVDRYWRVAEALGAGDVPKRFHVPIDPVETEIVRAQMAGLPRPWLVIAVGAKWLTKRWPVRHFAELLRRAQSHFGGTCAFVGAGDDVALSLDAMRGLTGPVRDFTGKTKLPRLAALLALCDVMVGNDTGPLHLGSALGLPCVAPYTCTRVAWHGPYNSMSGGVETIVACGGSYRKTCPELVCMPELTPERLWPRLAETLNEWSLRNQPSRSA